MSVVTSCYRRSLDNVDFELILIERSRVGRSGFTRTARTLVAGRLLRGASLKRPLVREGRPYGMCVRMYFF